MNKNEAIRKSCELSTLYDYIYYVIPGEDEEEFKIASDDSITDEQFSQAVASHCQGELMFSA